MYINIFPNKLQVIFKEKCKNKNIEYYISDNTLGSLLNSNQGTNNFMSVALTKATLRQLMDAGMINITNKKYYAATISDIISILNNEP